MLGIVADIREVVNKLISEVCGCDAEVDNRGRKIWSEKGEGCSFYRG